MNKNYTFLNLLLLSFLIVSCNLVSKKNDSKVFNTVKKSKKTVEEKANASKERILHDFNMQKDPLTGVIPQEEKEKEFENALIERQSNFASKAAANSYISRGPSNLGGRTRSLKVDISDVTGKTMLAGGVSSGVFRTTDGGNSWSKVSPFDEIHNVTTIAQDPRVGFQNIWYYGTGEYSGNSASLGAAYRGHGVWKSTDSGLTWQQIPETAIGTLQDFDSFFDFVIDMEVHPVTGELFVGTAGKVYRLTNSGAEIEVQIESENTGWTDLEITSTGRVYVAIDGNANFNAGVWESETGVGSWKHIASSISTTDWGPSGRITLAIAPSNEDVIYALYNNGSSNTSASPKKEADLFQYTHSTDTWVNYSSKLPDEPGSDSSGNDPFSIQGGYDLVVSVKPDDSNFVVIGGTNVYKISNITTDAMFKRIGGYKGAGSYAVYDEGGVKHHPDIHALEWDLSNFNVLYTGTDGGIHKTTNVKAPFISWENLNNDYLTYQYYHVDMINVAGKDIVIGGAQDNGTTIGGLDAGQPDKSTMTDYFGGDGAAVALAESKISFNGYAVYVSTQNGRMLRGNINSLTADIRPIEKRDASNEPEYYDSKFVTYFYMDPDNTSTIYYASYSKLLRTNDAEVVDGDTWELVGGLPFSEHITTFEATRGVYNAASSFLLVGGIQGNIFRLNDPQNATDLNSLKRISPPGIPVAGGNQYVSDIAVHPSDSDIVMVTYSNYGSSVKNIFITSNVTSDNPTWTEVERNLSSHSIRAAAIVYANNKTTYFVGTARGLYSSDDPTTKDWSLEGGNTMGIPVVSGLVYRPSDNILLIGTHGNGIYETNLNNALSVEDNSIKNIGLAMYPNPTQFELRFATNDFQLDDTTKFSIYDIKGKEIVKGNLRDKKINVENLSRGVYIVKLNQGNISVSRKFVKN